MAKNHMNRRFAGMESVTTTVSIGNNGDISVDIQHGRITEKLRIFSGNYVTTEEYDQGPYGLYCIRNGGKRDTELAQDLRGFIQDIVLDGIDKGEAKQLEDRINQLQRTLPMSKTGTCLKQR